MTASFKVIKAGFQTTVQDLGRFGYRHLGVPVSGGLDSLALRIANVLVGNEPDSPCLEATLHGPELYFLRDCIIAVTGADMKPSLSETPVSMWETVLCKAGETLRFGYRRSGCRSYIAFHGGIAVPEVLGSSSTLLVAGFGGFEGRSLQPGDIVKTDYRTTGTALTVNILPQGRRPEYNLPFKVKVLRGIDADMFSAAEYNKLFSQIFSVSNRCNRMGCGLEGITPMQSAVGPTFESYPVTPGSIQVPSSGNPIVLLNDAQSTGGYPQIGCIISADLWKLGQVVPGDSMVFEETSLEEALHLNASESKILKQIRQVSSGRFFQDTGKNLYEIVVDNPETGENN